MTIQCLPFPGYSTPRVCLHLPQLVCLYLGCFQNLLHPPNPYSDSPSMIVDFFFFFLNVLIFFFVGFFWFFFSSLTSSLCFAASLFPLSSALFPGAFYLYPALPYYPASCSIWVVDRAEQVSPSFLPISDGLLARSEVTLILLWLLDGKSNGVSLLPLCL